MRDSIKAQSEVLDERFRSCGGDGWMERLHTGCRWTEGPAYFPAGRYLLFSDTRTTGSCAGMRSPVR
jgi:gluconolactonase